MPLTMDLLTSDLCRSFFFGFGVTALLMATNTIYRPIGLDAAKAKAKVRAKEEKVNQEDAETVMGMLHAMHAGNRVIFGVHALN